MPIATIGNMYIESFEQISNVEFQFLSDGHMVCDHCCYSFDFEAENTTLLLLERNTLPAVGERVA